ncbi:MAG: HD domain-containing protein [Pseudanabaenales cyanobacterium]|nr:HD domain-containing protein [Pseudanabaenales cyanobacterium]
MFNNFQSAPLPNSLDAKDIGLILKALDFAARKHRDQRRKDPAASPYINHPIGLVNILWNEAGIIDSTVIVSALLHDTVEDTTTTFEELEQEFGQTIRQIVGEVTDDKSLPKQVRKQLQVEHAAHISDRAKLVKLADKIANVRDLVNSPPTDWPLTRKQAYLAWAKQVIDQMRGAHPPLEALFDQSYQQGMTLLADDQK